ncbi:MAG TPA: glycosyltransferase family A protein [Planosporangium sp.]|jgi:glycosyltransferase involved in cell wall biosynthesis|nr:glycosyltransferase family A protein [Planosporangium sp.]
MPLLSVLTAARPERGQLLAEAGDSLSRQDLPAGWELEWIVQEDAPTSTLAEVTQRFPFARHQANGESLGIAVTRNVGLTRANGSLVHVLDSDDLLLPHGLRTAIEAFDAHPHIHWVAGQADDLLPDSSRLPFPPMMAAGLIEPGVITTLIIEQGLTPVLCAGLTIRTETARALGGWVAAPRSEDLALLVSVAELTAGYLTPEVTWLYRRHAGQITRQTAWYALQGQSTTLIRQRIAAMRQLGLRVTGQPVPEA